MLTKFWRSALGRAQVAYLSQAFNAPPLSILFDGPARHQSRTNGSVIGCAKLLKIFNERQ